MATLYEIKAEMEQAINNLLASTDEETGEVEEACIHALEDLQMQMDEKLDNIGCYIKNLIAEAKVLKEEEQALKARREAKEKRAESLKNYMASVLDGQKFESPRVVCSWRKSESVAIENLDLIPDDFKVTKTEVQPDKTKIKEALKAGGEVSGAYLNTKNNLTIK